MKVVFQDLTKCFPGRTKNEPGVVAVNHFNFEIPDGKLVGLLGPSGCGKSTALNLISGIETATSGRIWFDDRDITDLPPEKRGIGLVFQNYALYPHLTVRENIRFPLENLRGDKKLSKEEMDQKVNEAAKLVQIEGLMDRKPSQMSGGQQQRVAIARALVKRPDILLLDEPLSNLDARLRLQTREEIRRIQTETGITTVFVTHDQEEAMSICDVMVVMKAGIIQQIGAPQQIYDDPVNLFVGKFLGSPQINVFDAVAEEGKLYIDGQPVLRVKGDTVGERQVFAAVRPEGFLVCPNGPYRCALKRVEVMGRDRSIVFSSPSAGTDTVPRAIVSSDETVDPSAGTVNFSFKPNKVFLFNKETEERIPCVLEQE